MSSDDEERREIEKIIREARGDVIRCRKGSADTRRWLEQQGYKVTVGFPSWYTVYGSHMDLDGHVTVTTQIVDTTSWDVSKRVSEEQ